MSTAPDDRQRFVASTWYLGGAQLVGTAATYALLYTLTRLGAESYGLWVLALLVASYLTPWATLGLAGSLIRFSPGLPSFAHQTGAYRLVCRAVAAASLVLALALLVAARPLAGFLLGGEVHWPLIAIAALLFPLEAQFQLGNSFLQAQERLGAFAALTSCRHLAEVGTLALLVSWLPRLEVLLLARAGILVLLVLGQHLLACRGVAGAALPNGRAELRRYLGFGFPMIPATFIWALIMGVDRFMLGRLGDLSTVAVYNAADAVAVFLLNYTRPVNGILQPRLANLVERDPAAAHRYLGAAIKFLAVALVPGVVGLGLVAGPVVALVGRPEFVPAARMVPVLALGYLLIGLSNPIYHLVFLRRGGRVFLGLYGACLAVNAGLNGLLIPVAGGLGAAVATLGAFAVYVGGLLLLSEAATLRVVWGQWRSVAVVAGCSLAMAVVLLVARQPGVLGESLWLLPLGAAVYGVLLGATGLISREEWFLLAGPALRLWHLGRSGREGRRFLWSK